MTTAGTGASQVRALLLDIEGTTTPVSFVYDVLFPYARRHLGEYLAARAGSGDFARLAAALGDEWSKDEARDDRPNVARPSVDDPDSLAAHLKWLMDRDRKSPALKRVQGEIWETGYRDGELRSQVFADVPPAFARWSAARITIAIYSSGSVLAQRLLFANTEAGDLTPAIVQYFDTAVGPKRSAGSYEIIARALGVPTADVLFVSDVDEELEAAQRAECRVAMCVRPGNAADASSVAPTLRSFDEIDSML